VTPARSSSVDRLGFCRSAVAIHGATKPRRPGDLPVRGPTIWDAVVECSGTVEEPQRMRACWPHPADAAPTVVNPRPNRIAPTWASDRAGRESPARAGCCNRGAHVREPSPSTRASRGTPTSRCPCRRSAAQRGEAGVLTPSAAAAFGARPPCVSGGPGPTSVVGPICDDHVVDVPDFVTHYHLAGRRPFLNLCDLGDDDLVVVMAELDRSCYKR